MTRMCLEKKISQATVTMTKRRSNSPVLNWALIHLLYIERKATDFNGLDIESASVLAWRCNIQTQEASHILLLSHSRAQHFLKSDLQLNDGYVWQTILFFHSCAVMLYSCEATLESTNVLAFI